MSARTTDMAISEKKIVEANFFFKLANSKLLKEDCNFKIAFNPILNMQKIGSISK